MLYLHYRLFLYLSSHKTNLVRNMGYQIPRLGREWFGGTNQKLWSLKPIELMQYKAHILLYKKHPQQSGDSIGKLGRTIMKRSKNGKEMLLKLTIWDMCRTEIIGAKTLLIQRLGVKSLLFSYLDFCKQVPKLIRCLNFNLSHLYFAIYNNFFSFIFVAKII